MISLLVMFVCVVAMGLLLIAITFRQSTVAGLIQVATVALLLWLFARWLRGRHP